MKTLILLLSMCFFSSLAQAHKKHTHADSHTHGHAHEALGAHVHGEVEVAIVSSGKQMAIELKSPGESLIGFEHEPKTEEEKAQLKSLQDSWKSNAFDAFTLSPHPEKCSLVQANLVPEYDGGHSVFNGEALYECESPLEQHKLTITLREKFSSIKKLSIEALPEGKSPLKHKLEGENKSYVLSF